MLGRSSVIVLFIIRRTPAQLRLEGTANPVMIGSPTVLHNTQENGLALDNLTILQVL